MSAPTKLVALVICAVGIVAGVSYWSAGPIAPPKPDTVYVKVSEKSKTVAETTIRTVTRWRARVDTVRGDTVLITKVELDTIFARCEECAAQLLEHRRVSDSTIYALTDSIFTLNRALARCGKQKPWYAVAGLAAGALACGA